MKVTDTKNSNNLSALPPFGTLVFYTTASDGRERTAIVESYNVHKITGTDNDYRIFVSLAALGNGEIMNSRLLDDITLKPTTDKILLMGCPLESFYEDMQDKEAGEIEDMISIANNVLSVYAGKPIGTKHPERVAIWKELFESYEKSLQMSKECV